MHSRQMSLKDRGTLWLAAVAICFLTTSISQYTQAQSPGPNKVSLLIRADQPKGTINRKYMTSDSDSTLARLRRQNGRDKPWAHSGDAHE